MHHLSAPSSDSQTSVKFGVSIGGHTQWHPNDSLTACIFAPCCGALGSGQNQNQTLDVYTDLIVDHSAPETLLFRLIWDATSG